MLTILAFFMAGSWTPLFDGKSTTGWVTHSQEAFPSGAWRVEDGCLRSVGSEKWFDISTTGRYRDFELQFEWKLGEGTNSGVKYLVHGVRTGRFPGIPKALGFEMQLLDDERSDEGKRPKYRTGSLYSFVAAEKVPAAKAGQWRTARIVVDGMRIEHWIDGVRVMQTRIDSAELRGALAGNDRADIVKPSHLDTLIADPSLAYPLTLTHHGGDAWFRNIRIRKLR